jgi:hypothetical protein
MRINSSSLALCLFSLMIYGCAPKAEPGKIVGAPDPVYYGACSPHSVAFIYELPSEVADPSKAIFVYAQYRLIRADGSEVAKDQVRLSSAGGAFTGTLDMNPLGPLLGGGEGSLVFYGQLQGAWPFMGGYLPYKEILHSDSVVVDVQPCLPTPTPSATSTPTATATITPTATATQTSTPAPEPTKKPKEDEPTPCGQNGCPP